MSFRSSKLLAVAHDQPCALCGAVGTTVAAHVNNVALGKGTGIKCLDYYVAWLCSLLPQGIMSLKPDGRITCERNKI